MKECRHTKDIDTYIADTIETLEEMQARLLNSSIVTINGAQFIKCDQSALSDLYNLIGCLSEDIHFYESNFTRR